jgi:uncharacterized protein (TIGR02246 family)
VAGISRRKIAILAPVLASTATGFSLESDQHSQDEAAIRRVIANLSDAWTKGDAKMWADQFTDDADFTAWMGSSVKGRDAIARGHEALFSRVYNGTKQRINVDSVRFLSADVAVAHADATVVKQDAQFPEAPQVVFAAVFVKQGKDWKIAVFHNTRIHSREEVEAFRAKQ